MAINMLSDTKHGGYGTEEYVVDTVEDLKQIKFTEMGTLALVLATSEVYMVNGSGEWVAI